MIGHKHASRHGAKASPYPFVLSGRQVLEVDQRLFERVVEGPADLVFLDRRPTSKSRTARHGIP